MGCGSGRSATSQEPKHIVTTQQNGGEVVLNVGDQKALTDSLQKIKAKLLDEKRREKSACKKFNAIDKDGSGYISFEEMFKYIQDKAKEKKKPAPSAVRVQELMAKYDKDKNGMLSREEFAPFLFDSLKATCEQYIVAYAKKEAPKYRKKKDIKTTPEAMAKAKELGALLRDSSLYAVVLRGEMKAADKDSSGTLDIEEFFKFTKTLCNKYQCVELSDSEVKNVLEDIGLKGILGLCLDDVLYASHATLLISQLITAGEA